MVLLLPAFMLMQNLNMVLHSVHIQSLIVPHLMIQCWELFL
ncbi:hypothetical protein KPNEU47_KP47_00760 [Klebsiella pneumoniae]|nr:hypothetical protein KPNEU47_KP47_00760 [Klebsiella pneumoniae]CAI3915419.1 hypothetical protein KPNEU34_KP34_01434 [Klebsiella pneumoniae]